MTEVSLSLHLSTSYFMRMIWSFLVNHLICEILWNDLWSGHVSFSLRMIHQKNMLGEMKVYMPWWPKTMTITEADDLFFYYLLFHGVCHPHTSWRVIWQQKWWARKIPLFVSFSISQSLPSILYLRYKNVMNELRDGLFSSDSQQSQVFFASLSFPARFHAEILTEIMQSL
jgi:hypothetical protein